MNPITIAKAIYYTSKLNNHLIVGERPIKKSERQAEACTDSD
jgi:hypothetical protein